MQDTFKLTEASQRFMFLEWLHGHYEDAKKNNLAEYCWCLDLQQEEDICLSISGYTVQQIRDDIEKKNMPLRIMRVFRTDLSFEEQIRDL